MSRPTQPRTTVVVVSCRARNLSHELAQIDWSKRFERVELEDGTTEFRAHYTSRKWP